MVEQKQILQGFKRTEIGLIPEDWELKSIDELANVVGGGTPSTFIPNYWDGNIHWFTPTEIGTEKYIYESKRKITLDGLKNCSAKILPRGTILLTSRASIGEVGILLSEGCTNQGFQSLIVKSAVSNEYLYYLINTKKKVLIQNASGSTFLEISPNRLKKIIVPFPTDPTEQEAIAKALSEADALIAELEKLIAKKRAIKQGTMQELLKPKEGWEKNKLGKIADIVRGASPRPIEDPKWFEEQSKIGWVRISDITKSNKYLFETSQRLSELGIINSRYVSSKNLIMSICATVGRPILTEIDICIHDGFVVFRNTSINKEYLYYFLSFIEKDWSTKGQTGSQMNLNTNIIKATPISFPSLKEQSEIVSILSDMDTEIEALESKLEKYKHIKQGMMQNLLTGKIRLCLKSAN